MKVLGIAHEHNSTVCLMEDGEITFCQSEERLNRIKNSSGFPSSTLQYIYDKITPPESIDLAVIYEKTIYGFLAMRNNGFRSTSAGRYMDRNYVRPTLRRELLKTSVGWKLHELKVSRMEKNQSLRREAESFFSEALKLDSSRIKYIDHHLSHAYTVLPNISDWGKCLVFTLDGYGDGLCATVSLFEEGEIKRVDACEDNYSLGNLYCETAWILGMKSLEDEFKVMGLAPYARTADFEDIIQELRTLLNVNDHGRWEGVRNPIQRFDKLQKIYQFRRFDRIAGAIQSFTEELILKWVRCWITRTGCRNIAVSGGVFMNVKVSQHLADFEQIDRFFVMPSAGDESCAIGSAAWGTLSLRPDVPLHPLSDLYLGMEFSELDIETALRNTDAATRYDISKPADINHRVAELLAKNEIVARCSGRMEFGARSLGNRSILANPKDPSNVARINQAIKGRDFWMPFAPSIIEPDMGRYTNDHNRIYTPYMCVALRATSEARSDLAAAIHSADGTLRPQSVRRQWNPDFYEIISCFKSITGIGAVLNTSFNLHGEPIVCSPTDAIRTIDKSGLRHLALGATLLSKRSHSTLHNENHDRTGSLARA